MCLDDFLLVLDHLLRNVFSVCPGSRTVGWRVVFWEDEGASSPAAQAAGGVVMLSSWRTNQALECGIQLRSRQSRWKRHG